MIGRLRSRGQFRSLEACRRIFRYQGSGDLSSATGKLIRNELGVLEADFGPTVTAGIYFRVKGVLRQLDTVAQPPSGASLVSWEDDDC